MNSTRRDFLKWSAVAGAWAGIGGGVSRAIAATAREGQSSAGAGKKLLILGGTAFLGPELVEAAKAHGWTITLFNRGITNPKLFPELEKLRGDRDPKVGEGLKALEGRKWDAVVDTSGYVPRIAGASATLLAPSVKQYVFISTISVFPVTMKPGGDESTAVGTIDDPTTEKVTGDSYGPLKALCEQAVEKAMPGRTTTIRPGLIVGPNDPSDRFTYWPVRVDRGGEVLAPGSPDDPVQLIDVRDLAEWTIRMIESGDVGTYVATGPAKSLGIGAMLEACKKASGSNATFTWADSDFLQEQHVAAWQDMPAWVPGTGETAGFARVNVSKAIGKGLTFRPIEVTAKDTLEWWKKQPEDRRKTLHAGISPDREAQVLQALHEKKSK
ncbi:MAG: twin-arginine translocation signal domain-containing protein [Planctomycetes bacterium]|nr:twin-arginine translocation signal domain-containing protein [Planctomycetota bacterium]